MVLNSAFAVAVFLAGTSVGVAVGVMVGVGVIVGVGVSLGTGVRVATSVAVAGSDVAVTTMTIVSGVGGVAQPNANVDKASRIIALLMSSPFRGLRLLSSE